MGDLGESAAPAFPWRIYLSWSLSAWGDRMWHFAGSIFMAKLEGHDSLRCVTTHSRLNKKKLNTSILLPRCA